MGTDDVLFSTQRLLVRPLAARDLEAFAANRALPEVARYQSWTEEYSRADAEVLLAAQRSVEWGTLGTRYQLALEEAASHELVGDAAIHFVDASRAEISITIVQERQRRGLGREAVTALLWNLLSRGGRRKVTATVDAGNAPAVALLRAVGLRQEAHFREHALVKGRWRDELVFAALACEVSSGGVRAAKRPAGARAGDLREPCLTTERLTLRPLASGDWAMFHQLYTDPAVMRHVCETMEAEIEQRFRTRLLAADTPWRCDGGRPLCLTIVERGSGELVGVHGFPRLEWNPTRQAEVGYLLLPKFHGKGYGKEALAAVVHFGFTDCGFNRLHAVVSASNAASRALLEKAGFRQEGVQRQHFFAFGDFVDNVLFGLLRSEYDDGGSAAEAAASASEGSAAAVAAAAGERRSGWEEKEEA